MMKLRTILAGTAVAVFAQFAAAQSDAQPIAQPCSVQIVVPASEAPSDPNDPRYVDQSRLNYADDPLVKRRVEAGGGASTSFCTGPARSSSAPGQ